MSVLKSYIKFYLTSVEPAVAQIIYSQSIGGYPAIDPSDATISLVYPEDPLNGEVDIYDTSLLLTAYADLANETIVGINSEVIDVNAISRNIVSVDDRSVNNKINIHQSTDIVKGMSVNSVFDNQFNSDLKQYRCMAIKNTNNTSIASNMSVYLKQNSRNNRSLIKMAIEAPINDYITGTATGGTSLSIVNTNIIGTYNDNIFERSLVGFLTGSNVGQTRTVSSYDSATGTFVLSSALPYVVSFSDQYYIEPSPCQRLVSGTISPSFAGGYVSGLSKASSIAEAIDIDVNDNRMHGSHLQPNDIIYIWLERSLSRDSDSFANNSATITLRYTVV